MATSWEAEQADKKQITDFYSPKYLQMISLAAGYGQIAVRSSFLLNGGILFVLPTYITAVYGNGTNINTESLLWAAVFFVIGIAFSALVCLSAYLNFSWQAHVYEHEQSIDIVRVQDTYDSTHKIRLGRHRTETVQFHEARIKILNERVNLTFLISVGLALSSYVVFVIGCFFAAKVMLFEENLTVETGNLFDFFGTWIDVI